MTVRRHSVLESRSPARHSARRECDICSIQPGTRERGCSNIDDILENGCISRCSLDKKTGALHLYVRRNKHNYSSPSSTEYKPECKKSNIYSMYKPNVRRKKQPCPKPKQAPKTQIVKEQNVQTEITISADVDMWHTKEYCRCDLRDGKSESPEPCPPPPCTPAKPSTPPKEIEREPAYEEKSPLRIEEKPPSVKKKSKIKRSPNDGRLAFRNFNIAFQKIILNTELSEEMKHLNKYYVTQDPHYKLKFEKRVMKNGVREMNGTNRRKSEGGTLYHHNRNRELLLMKTPEREDLKTFCTKEGCQSKLDDGQLYLARNALFHYMRRGVGVKNITGRRVGVADRVKHNERNVGNQKEQRKYLNKKEIDKSFKENDRKRRERSQKVAKGREYDKEKGVQKSEEQKRGEKFHKENVVRKDWDQEERKQTWDKQENKCQKRKEDEKLYEERMGKRKEKGSNKGREVKKEEKGYNEGRERQKSHQEKGRNKSHKVKGGRKSQKEYRKRVEIEMKKNKKREENRRLGKERAVRNNVHVWGFTQ